MLTDFGPTYDTLAFESRTPVMPKPPLFSIGQPVFVRWCWKHPYNVTDIMRGPLGYKYELQKYNGEVMTENEDNLERMKPLARERLKDGRVRTRADYFYSVRGGRV